MDEAERLAALRALNLLDTEPEALFDSLTELAALTFQVPVALVSMVDFDRQWFKSCVGLNVSETSRDVAFCSYTIQQAHVLVVPDAKADPRFRDNLLVTGEPNIRFYAGAPITGPGGHKLGSLCVIDFVPRKDFTATEVDQLTAMAKAVSAAIELRRDIAAVAEVERRLHAADQLIAANEARLAFLVNHSADLILRLDPASVVTWASPSAARFGWTPQELLGARAADLIHPDDLGQMAERRVSRFAQLADPSGHREYRVRRRDESWVWVEESPTVIRDGTGEAIELVNVLRDVSDRKRAEKAAADIQAGMLAPRTEIARIDPRIEADAVLQPARTVGGDFYDVFKIGEDRVGFLLGDVTGKGMPAALFMSLSKALSHSLVCRSPDDLPQALSAINDELSRNNREAMALALLVGVVDLANSRLSMCNAGLDDPFVVDLAGNVRDLPMIGGPPLCAAEGFSYLAEHFQLAGGDAVVAVTDGITEAQDKDGQFYGRARTRRELARPGAMSGIVDGLVASVRVFEGGGEPSDDLAVVALRCGRNGISS